MADETGHVVGCDFYCSPHMSSVWVVRRYPNMVRCVCFYAYVPFYFFVNISTAKLMHKTSRFVFTMTVSPLFRLFLPFVISIVGIVDV